jgi:A/G-specific adenine glycosylase
MKSGLTKPALAVLRRRLLAWYDRHGRALPWRNDTVAPYATLVSESMLQQTQVATVIPYYLRFLERFPTLASLAAANIDDVLPYWDGLGYYRRCHHLHAAAGRVVRDHDGRMPGTVESLMTLPGVGRYTAGAIASIAFRVPAPAVDGNAARVLARLEGSAPADRPARPTEQLWALAADWVSRSRPGDFNQALMELGATVCTPRAPRCPTCPLRTHCAFAAGTNAPTPARRHRPRLQIMALVTVAVQHHGCLLYHRRPSQGLWSGLWEWPTDALDRDATAARVARGIVRELAPDGASRSRPIGVLAHVLTHRRITIHAFRVALRQVFAIPPGYRWLSPGEESAVAMSSAQRRLLALLREKIDN